MQNLNLIQLSEIIQIPSIVGWNITKEGEAPKYCLKIEVNGNDIIVFQDFFTAPLMLNDTWNIERDNENIIFSKDGTVITAEPIKDKTLKELPQVKWNPDIKAKNLLNKDLWEENLIREIGGVTYYPLDLFRFTQHKFILQQPVIKTLYELLKIYRLTNITKTLYYYIKNDKIYVGVWDYKRYLPLDPIQCGMMTTISSPPKKDTPKNDLFTLTWLNCH